MRLLSLVPLLLVATLVPGPVRAADSYESCKGFIDTLPAVLTVQGTWCLNKDLTTSQTTGAGITISGNNIAIDCNGFKLGGFTAGSSTYASGIYETGRLNSAVRDCVIRGFHTGIYLEGGGGHLVEDNRLDGNTAYGMRVIGEDTTVRRNIVLDTGGSAIESDTAIGIWTIGRTDVIDNTIAGIHTPFSGAMTIGLRASGPTLSTIANNRIRGIVAVAGTQMYGMYIDGAGYTVIRDNSIGGPELTGSMGLACVDGNLGSSFGNAVVGFDAGVIWCTSTGDVVKDI